MIGDKISVPEKDNDMACLMKGKVPRKTTNKNDIGRIRVVTDKDSEYGCPKDFIKLSEYMCIHVRRDKTGNLIETEFEDSRSYCTKIFDGASLLYFLNLDDALRFWNWLGKCLVYETIFILFKIVISK